jgi:uracil-DNA glycosylase
MDDLLKTLDEEFKTQTVEDKINDMFDNFEEEKYDSLKKSELLPKTNPPVIAGICPEWWNILVPTSEVGVMLQEAINKIATTVIKPIHRDILNFTRFTDPKKIKVLIIGQDPYDTETHAHGLAFSSQMDITPKSLGNIFKSLSSNQLLLPDQQTKLPKQKPLTNNLTSWAAQGVLLLNTALTVLANKPKSHIDIWQEYIIELFKSIGNYLLSQGKQLIVILWGKEAEKYEKYFTKHKILKYHHPSPLAGDFSNCPNFLECNKILQSLGQQPIIWDPDYPTWLEVYTDGSSYPNNTGPDVASGYAAIFTTGIYKGLKIYGRTENKEPFFSNNVRAEGTAIIKALERVVLLPSLNRQLLHIVTDCEFWINMIRTWIPSWIDKFGIEVIMDYEKNLYHHKNPDLVCQLWTLLEKLRTTGTFIIISHVYSHDKKKGSLTEKTGTEYMRYIYNKLADILANHVRVKLQNGQYGEMMSALECEGFKF